MCWGGMDFRGIDTPVKKNKNMVPPARIRTSIDFGTGWWIYRDSNKGIQARGWTV